MSDPSTMYFPLRSNAAALVAGSSVAAVRRRIVLAGLLHDNVILEDGIHISWAGETGASDLTIHGEHTDRWQSTQRRGRAQGVRHYFAAKPANAPPGTPARPIVSTIAAFSWKSTFEPFRGELPRTAADWLDFGHVTNDEPAKEIVREWQSQDRLSALRRPTK